MSENAATNRNISLRLSAQRALWGAIPPSLRAVSVGIDDQRVYFRCIFDGVSSEDEPKLLLCAATEIIADFPAPYTIETELLHIAYPNPMTHLESLIFLRFEEPVQPSVLKAPDTGSIPRA
jgi:hypothetical protein